MKFQVLKRSISIHQAIHRFNKNNTNESMGKIIIHLNLNAQESIAKQQQI